MSAYSDYKCGAISEDEFKSLMRRECEDVDFYDRPTCRDCGDYDECCKQVCLEGIPMCDKGMDREIDFEDEYEIYEAMQDKEFLRKTYGSVDVEAILKKNYRFDIQEDWREWKGE